MFNPYIVDPDEMSPYAAFRKITNLEVSRIQKVKHADFEWSMYTFFRSKVKIFKFDYTFCPFQRRPL